MKKLQCREGKGRKEEDYHQEAGGGTTGRLERTEQGQIVMDNTYHQSRTQIDGTQSKNSNRILQIFVAFLIWFTSKG